MPRRRRACAGWSRRSLAIVYATQAEPATEQDPLADDSPTLGDTVTGVRSLEAAVAELPEGVSLRYGLFYGPGTWYSRTGPFADAVRQRKRPASSGVSSFVHVVDAARAAILAIDWPTGVVNIVDDEPAAGTEWLPRFAAAIGAPPPPIGENGGTSRAFRIVRHGRSSRWTPQHPTWRDGFLTSLLTQTGPMAGWNDHPQRRRSPMVVIVIVGSRS